MNNSIWKIWKNKKGTALLVALLVMGVLIAISLALSSLVLGEARSTKELLDSGRAYYAAESGIEQALYMLDDNLPGWEGKPYNLGEAGENAVFSYEVKNKCDSYPCFDPNEYDLDSLLDFPENYYDVLDLNESITIPLFTIDENGNVMNIKDFAVEFFVGFNPMTDLIFTDNTVNLSGWDVLRWKVFGMRKSSDGRLLTESIHDFTAVSSVQNSEGVYTTNASHPSWFGTKSCNNFSNRVTSSIDCKPYANVAISQKGKYCGNTEVRDFYLYDDDGERFQARVDCYPISNFLDRNNTEKHPGIATGLNYLSLTNLMNPSMLSSDVFPLNEDKMWASKIYFRVETDGGEGTVREFAEITSDGFSGDTKQSIKVNIKRDSYMPVFNFSIYSTYQAEGETFYTYSATKQDEEGLSL